MLRIVVRNGFTQDRAALLLSDLRRLLLHVRSGQHISSHILFSRPPVHRLTLADLDRLPASPPPIDR